MAFAPRKIAARLSAFAAVLIFAAGAHAQCGTLFGECLVDGDLDLADSGGQTSNSPWVLTVNFPDTVQDAAQFQTGFANAQNNSTQSPGTGTGIWLKAFEGQQEDPGQPKADADLTQSVVVPTAGNYRLNFVAGREDNFTADEFFVSLTSSGTGGSDSIDLLTAPMILGNIGGSTSPALGGNPFSVELSGVSAGDTLTVVGAMVGGIDAKINPQSGFLDSFSLTRVPEPTTAMLVGLASLAGLGRRRR